MSSSSPADITKNVKLNLFLKKLQRKTGLKIKNGGIDIYSNKRNPDIISNSNYTETDNNDCVWKNNDEIDTTKTYRLGINVDSPDATFTVQQGEGVNESILKITNKLGYAVMTINDTGTCTFLGDVNIDGTLTSNKSETIETINVNNNWIYLNFGTTAAPTENSGISIVRGDLPNFLIYFDETDDVMRIGQEDGLLQAVATRDDNPQNEGIPYWYDTHKKFVTDPEFIFTSADGQKILRLPVNSAIDANDLYFDGDLHTPFTEHSIPFIGDVGVLAQNNADFTYNDGTKILTTPNITVPTQILNTGTEETTTLTSGALQTRGGCAITKSLKVGIDATINGDLVVGDALNVTGIATVGTFVCKGVVSVNQLTAGAATINGVTNFTNATEATNPGLASVNLSGGLSIAKKLIVVGDANIRGNTTFVGHAIIEGNLSGDTLSVTNTATFNGLTNFNNTTTLSNSALLVSNNILDANDTTAAIRTLGGVSMAKACYIGTTLTVVGAASLSSTLNVAGVSTLASAVILRSATVGTTLTVTGETILSSTLNAGDSTLASAVITESATIGTTLGVTGITTLADALTINGVGSKLTSACTTDASTITDGAIRTAGGVSIAKSCYIGTALTVVGASTLNSLCVTNNATVGGTLGVTGVSTLASAVISGTATIGSTLRVTGVTTLADSLIQTGTSNSFISACTTNADSITGAIRTSGGVSMAKNCYVGTTLTVADASTLNSLCVTNNATVGGTLNVTGLSTLDSLSVSNNVNINGTLSVDSQVKLMQTLMMSGSSSRILSLCNISASNISGAIQTYGGVSMALNCYVGTTLTVVGASTLASATITGAATVGATLGVTGVSTLAAVTMSGDLTIGSSPTKVLIYAASGNTTIAGTFAVSGSTTLAALNAGATTVSSTLGVSGVSTLASAVITGAATVGATFEVSGTSTLVAVTMSGDLNIGSGPVKFAVSAASGNANIAGTLGVTGTSTLNSLDVNNNTTVGGTLGVYGVSTLTSAVILGTATVGSTLNVTGVTTLADSLVVNGLKSTITSTCTIDANSGAGAIRTFGGVSMAKACYVGLGLTVGGAAVLSSTLAVSGVSTLTSAVILGTATVGSTLNVTGVTTLANALVINGVNSTITSVCTTDADSGAGAIRTFGGVSMAKSCYVGTTLTVAGASTLNSLVVTNNTTIGGTLGVTGVTTVFALNAAGATTLSSTLNVSGVSTLASAVITGTVTIGSALGVTGISTLSVLHAGASTLISAAIKGAVTVGTTLGVSGTSTLATVNMSGDLRVGFDSAKFTVAAASGNTNIAGTLEVTGETTLSSILNAGASTLNSITVTNGATIGTTLGVVGNTSISGASSTLTVPSGFVGVGTSSINSCAALQIDSTEFRGFLPPRMTGLAKISISNPVEGLQVYDTTAKCISYYNGVNWYVPSWMYFRVGSTIAAPTNVAFDTLTASIDARIVKTSSSSFTVSDAGDYEINFSAVFTGTASERYCLINLHINGDTCASGAGQVSYLEAGTSFGNANISRIISLLANDVISFTFSSLANNNISLSSLSHGFIKRIS